MKCRHCDNLLNKSFLDLGKQPLANSLLPQNYNSKVEPKYPLEVFFCNICYLVQIDKVVNQKKIFNKEYPYFSSYSDSWLLHAKKYVSRMIKKYKLHSKSLVIEIASNDGYLLKNFHLKNIPCLGIEPTKNTAEAAVNRGIRTISKFFSSQLAKKIIQKNPKPDLIVCKNVLAHVPNLNDFIRGLDILSNKKTVITIEFPHLLKLIREFQYDTIYHEHFSYFSLISLNIIFKKFNLQIFDVEEIPTHGGSLRIYICKRSANRKIKNSLDKLIKKEKVYKLNKIKTFEEFAKKVEINKKNINKFLSNCRSSSKNVVAYGAAAKGNTLLNYCEINTESIKQIFDISPHKQNKLMPGSRIKISHPDMISSFYPDYIILLPWNLKYELVKKLKHHKKKGCKFVTFVPSLKVF